MRILFTNNTLDARAGTEMYVHDAARELKRLGHETAAYSPRLGTVAELLRAAGVPVLRDLAALPFRPDVIHGHHHIETMTALASLPGVPAIYFCHGSAPWEEMPPVFPRILRYIAVSAVCRERIVREAAVADSRITTLLNFADTGVFLPRAPLPARPARALVFSNYATGGNYAAAVRAACAQCGMAVDVRGVGVGSPASAPEALLPQYDLVFAKGRAALEAMAVGCAVILCDAAGLGPMVTTGNFGALRPVNFGLAALGIEPTVGNIAAAIHSYDASDAVGVRDLVRSQAGLAGAAGELVRLYGEVIAENAALAHDPVAEVRALGAYLQALDSILKRGDPGEPIPAPPAMVPDAVALPARVPWLRRVFGIGR